MDWKNSFHRPAKKQSALPYKAVSSITGARELLDIMKCDAFTTVGGEQVAVKDATDEQIRQIMKKLGVTIMTEAILDKNGNPV
jgi:hypothetical protein